MRHFTSICTRQPSGLKHRTRNLTCVRSVQYRGDRHLWALKDLGTLRGAAYISIVSSAVRIY